MITLVALVPLRSFDMKRDTIDFEITRTSLSPGKQAMQQLMGRIANIILDTDWDPVDIQGINTVRMIEVKAMLMNAEKKLTKIAKEEGYIEN